MHYTVSRFSFFFYNITITSLTIALAAVASTTSLGLRRWMEECMRTLKSIILVVINCY